MRILALDTSGKEASVAVVQNDTTLAADCFMVGLWHGREIMIKIDEVLKRARLGYADIDTVVVGQGPGSYTGVRVGITTAKTLAWAIDAELVGVSTFLALAAAAPADKNKILAVIDAKREEVYAALYERDGLGALKVALNPLVARPDELLPKIGGAFVVGDAAELYRGSWESAGATVADQTCAHPKAEVMARLASQRPAEPFPHSLKPIYMRLSAAEERLPPL